MSTAAEARERLEEIWEDRPGAPGWLSTVDHKRIGKRYLVTSFVFFVVGGIQALLLRAQLAQPQAGVLGPDAYNQLFSMHGTTMIFLFNTPVIAAFANYLVPLQIGARDMAFPRLNALSYWIYAMSGVFIYASFFLGAVPDAGWFAYVPLTLEEFSPGRALDFWAIGIVFLGISTTVGGINFIVTIFKFRAPGMTLRRLPVFCWAILVTSFLILFSLPAITLGPLMLELDRALATAFFDAARGGDPLLYQHLFWFWGHPEVYILFVPATGMISMIVPALARAKLVSYTLAVASTVAIGFISFGVWVHHMFATGLPDLANLFFGAAGLVIAVPSGIQIFVWLGTLLVGRPRWNTTPLLFALGFVITFVLGGITGVMVSMVPFDLQATDSYFVVAHLHYVLFGGVVFPIFAALYFWLPKMYGWLLREHLGRLSFWLMFIGFHVAFGPQHVVGLLGMPRRVYTYPEGLGWDGWNLVSTIGAFTVALGVLVTLANVAWSAWRRVPADRNPWGAESLEWATSSPPPDYNFAEVPIIRDDAPLWRFPATGAGEPQLVEPDGVLLGPHGAHHEAWRTDGPTADVPARLQMPSPSQLPFWLSAALLAASVAALNRGLWWFAGSIVAAAAVLIRWHAEGIAEGAEG